MTPAKAVLSIVIGLAMIVVGLTTRQFYAGIAYFRPDRPIPRWQGLTLFLVVDGLFVVAGVSHLVMALLAR